MTPIHQVSTRLDEPQSYGSLICALTLGFKLKINPAILTNTTLAKSTRQKLKYTSTPLPTCKFSIRKD